MGGHRHARDRQVHTGRDAVQGALGEGDDDGCDRQGRQDGDKRFHGGEQGLGVGQTVDTGNAAVGVGKTEAQLIETKATNDGKPACA